jgi:hypothetical protein
MMTDIFISYASSDREKIIPLVQALKNQGWSIWWDRDIPPGKTFTQVIKEAIDNANCVMVIWSEESVASEWVMEEADIGKKRGILIPVLIENVEIPLGFGRIESAQLADWEGDLEHVEFKTLINSIAALIGFPKEKISQIESIDKLKAETAITDVPDKEPDADPADSPLPKQETQIEVESKIQTTEKVKPSDQLVISRKRWLILAILGVSVGILCIVISIIYVYNYFGHQQATASYEENAMSVTATYIEESIIATLSGVEGCPGARLHISERAYVPPGFGQSILSGPDLNFNSVIGQVQEGDIVKILDGPWCHFNWSVWKIETKGGLVGFTPESNGEKYWLLLLTEADESALATLERAAFYKTSTANAYIYYDDFTVPNNNWISKDGVGKKSFYNGGYRIELDAGQSTLSYLDFNETNVDIAVDVKNMNGEVNYTGVICRMIDDKNFYILLIKNDIFQGGQYSIAKITNGEWNALVDWEKTNIVITGENSNYISAVCNGNELSLSVNGQFIDRITDNDFSFGSIGLYVGSDTTGGTDVLFDNFLVNKP